MFNLDDFISEYVVKRTESMFEEDSLKGYSAFIVENAYQKELENFFDVVWGKNHAKYSFAEDKEILKLIDCIEES